MKQAPTTFSVTALWAVAGSIALARCMDQARHSCPPHAAQPSIALLGFSDCPHTPEMRANLTAALESMHTGWTFTEVDQEALAAGDVRRGYPTPTILVDGHDLFGLARPVSSTMSCRVYIGGVPSAEVIAARLTVWRGANASRATSAPCE